MLVPQEVLDDVLSQPWLATRPRKEKRESTAYVIIYFDVMAEKRVWPDAFFNESDAERYVDVMKKEGVHVYTITKVELK